jgi:uncharacterized membrane protein
MKRANLSVVIYVVLVFLSGVLVGVAGFGLYSAHTVGAKAEPCSPEALRDRYREELRTRLQLGPDQLKKLDIILEDTHNRFVALRDKYKPEVTVIQDAHANSIRAILDDRQRAEYEKLRQERRKVESEKHPRTPGC